MGDPAGVGPELCLEALATFAQDVAITPIVVGDRAVLEQVSQFRGMLPPETPVWTVAQFEEAASEQVPSEGLIVDLKGLGGETVSAGVVSAATGRAAYSYLDAAIGWAMQGRVDGIATAPLHKEALAAAGISEPGHTQILAAKTGVSRYCMLLTSPQITCGLVTTHIGLNEVASSLTVGNVLDTMELTHAVMSKLRGRRPILAVCGLNPHAGEGGLFGNREEEEIIVPAMDEAIRRGINVIGPLPADTAFLPSIRYGVDAYICMYHDQGLIPLKTLAFDEAVNVTVGLPIVRTSVDHGTALDIAWRGQVQTTSMMNAVRLAATLHQMRDVTL